MPKSNANDKRNIRCVQCKYNLRSITRPVCPECGKDYKSLKAMMAECIKPDRFEARFLLAVHCVLLGAAISNVIGTSLVMGHYWLAIHLGNPWLPDPKSIGLFRLPVIGDLMRSLGFFTWIFTPIVTAIGVTAFAAALSLRWAFGSGSRLKFSYWFLFVIILVSFIVFVMGLERDVITWLFD